MSPTPKPWERNWSGGAKPWEMKWDGAEPPVPGMEKLGALPGPAAPPNIVGQDTGPKRQGESTFDYLSRRVNNSKRGQEIEKEQEADRAAGRQIVQGVKDVATAPTGERQAHGASQVIRGAMHYGRGVIPALGPIAPVATATGLVVGMGTQAVTEKGLEAVGVPEGYRELGGDVAGLVAGGGAAKLTKAGSGSNAATATRGAVSGAVKAIPEAIEGSILKYTGVPRIVRGAVTGAREALKAKVDAAAEKMAAADAAPVQVSPGEALAKEIGTDWAKLSAEDKAGLELAAKARANAAAQPVGPRQPLEAPPAAEPVQAPVEPTPEPAARSLADELRAEMEAKRTAQPQQPAAAPQPTAPKGKHKHTPPQRLPQGYTRAGTIDANDSNLIVSRPLPRTGTAADYAPRPVESPPVAGTAAEYATTPEAPPLPRQEVIQPQPTAAPAAVEPPAAPAPLNPVQIGQRILKSMGVEDASPKQGLDTFNELRGLAAKTGKPIEELYQKYTGEPLAGVQMPPEAPAPVAPKPEPKPLSHAQAEAAMARTKAAQYNANPDIDPNEVRTFTNAAGEQKSKSVRAEEKKAFNADAKAKRFADAFHAEGITAEDVANMTAEDAKAMTDGLIAKGVLKKGEMPPNSSMPRLVKHLKDLEREAKKAATAKK